MRPTPAARPSRAACLAALLLACQPDPTDTGAGPDPETVPLAGTCPLAERWGGFAVEEVQGRSSVAGKVLDGVIPQAVLTDAGAEGDCRLLRRENLRCEPTCTASQTCGFDGVCVPYPAGQDLGTVEIFGLAEPVSMEPTEPGAVYYDTDVAHPLQVEGALVTLRAEGGAHGPGELHGVGVPPIAPTDDTLEVSAGAGLAVGWQAAAGRAEVVLSLNIDQHGATPLTLECAFADDGAGEVPADLLDGMMGAGVSGFPSARLTRRTADRVPIGAGCTDFVVSSAIPLAVEVVGHIPCDEPRDCPPPMTCDLETQTCE